MVGDPTEGAILVAALKMGASIDLLNQTFPRAQEIPFDSVRKRMLTIHSVDDQANDDLSLINNGQRQQNPYIINVKGAPDVVLGLCTHIEVGNDRLEPLTEARRQEVLAANDAMTNDALRVLGVACRTVTTLPEEIDSEELERDLTFVGLIGMIDPAREEVSDAIDTANRAGIRTIMITGDYLNTV